MQLRSSSLQELRPHTSTALFRCTLVMLASQAYNHCPDLRGVSEQILDYGALSGSKGQNQSGQPGHVLQADLLIR